MPSNSTIALPSCPTDCHWECLFDVRALLTDENGRASFSGMRTNRYPMSVDLGTGDASAVGLLEGTQYVASRAGRTSELALGLVRLSQLRGRLRLYELIDAPRVQGDSLKLRHVGGLGSVV